MSRPVPVLGFPSKTAAAAALRKKGVPLAKIAEALDTTPQAVGALLAGVRRRQRLREIRLAVARETFDGLALHARRRGIGVGELARRLLETIADDDMVDAILDDRDGR